MRVVLAVLGLVAPVLAGCFGAAVDSAPSFPGGSAPAFRYMCAGEDGAGAVEPCLAELPRGDAMLQQPYVAIHPSDARLMAVGVIHSRIEGDRALHAAATDRAGTRLAVYVSEDAGMTWRETFAPPPADADPAATSSQGEAALLFDPEGRLHVVGAARTERVGEPDDTNGNRHLRGYYARSDDLGRTWSASAWLDDDGRGADRMWIVRDPETRELFVLWQESWGEAGSPSERRLIIAWSRDDGATWSHLDADARPHCIRAGKPVLLDGLLRFACVRMVGVGSPAIQVHAFDPLTDRSLLIAEVEAETTPTFPFLTLLPDATLVMHYDRDDDLGVVSPLLHSRDGGSTWTSTGSARDWGDGEWGIARVTYAAADAFGFQHILARYDRGQPLLGGDRDGVVWRAEHEQRHVVLDRLGAVVHNVVLERWRSENAPEIQRRLGMGEYGVQEHPRCGFCNDGLAWTGDRALLAYYHQDSVALASVEAVGASARPLARLTIPPVRPYEGPSPPSGLPEPIRYDLQGRVEAPRCVTDPDPTAGGAIPLEHSVEFSFDVPQGTRFVNGTLSWDTAGPTPELTDLDVVLYDEDGDAFDPPDSVPETFGFELRAGDAGAWTAVVTNCENPPTDFTLTIELR